MNDELEQAFRQGYIAGRSEEDERLKKIAVHYGYTAQREQLIEECSEAILAAQKCKRHGSHQLQPVSNGPAQLRRTQKYVPQQEKPQT